MADEIKTRITIEGKDAQEVLRRISQGEDELARSTRKAGDEADETSRKGGRLTAAYTSMLGSIRGLVGGMLGVGGLIAAFRLSKQEMQENAQAARELAQAQLDLQFLTQGNSAAALNVVKQSAHISGRPQTEISAAFTQFVSQTANLTDDKRVAFFQQLIETSLTTSASPTALVELFSKGSNFVDDPQKLQNLIAQTIIESPESSPAKLATLLPRVLPVGQAAGLQPEVTAGLLAFSAGVAGSAEEGSTGLRNIIASLQGKGTPESAKILSSVGATSDLGFIGQLRALSVAFGQGKLDLPALETIAGRENLALLSATLGRLPDALATVGRVAGAANGNVDITKEALEKILADSPRQRQDLQARQAESRIGTLKANDLTAQRAQLGRILFEEQIRKDDLSPARRGLDLFLFDTATNLGFSPEFAAEFAQPSDAKIGITGTGGVPGLLGQPRLPSIADRVRSGLNAKPNINVTNIGTQFNTIDPTIEVLDTESIP